MAAVHAQIQSAQRGEVNSLSCPYCGGLTPKGETFCCDLMMKACKASLHRVEVTEQLEAVDRALRN